MVTALFFLLTFATVAALVWGVKADALSAGPMAAEAAAASATRSRFIWFLQSSDAQLEADRRRCLAPPSQPRRGSLVPDRQVSWLRIVAAGLLPKATASVDLAHGSPVTVTGSRRIRTGFPFQLSISPSFHAGMEPLRATYRRSLLVRRLAGITSPKR